MARKKSMNPKAPYDELGSRYLRVISLKDKSTIHNAFRDRRFKP